MSASQWAGSTRRQRLPADWPQLVAATKRRAGGRCEKRDASGRRCTARGTDCDHINRGDDHSPANLQWLCHPHHLLKTAAEANQARWSSPRARRAPETHPGVT